MNSPKILVVDDEPKVIHLVREILSAADYGVCTANTGERALEQAVMEQPDLVILDILLPDPMDGYEVARRLREFTSIPIIFLTGKVRESDLLQGFEVGADDYITKPFNSKELLVRIRAVLRRSQSAAGARPVDEEISCGDLTIDLLRRKVSVRGKEVHLTHTEYDLLRELALHLNQVMLHEQLLSAVWGNEYQGDVDYLRAYIHSLRQKLEDNPAEPRLILRSPGVGYSLVSPDEDKPLG